MTPSTIMDRLFDCVLGSDSRYVTTVVFCLIYSLFTFPLAFLSPLPSLVFLIGPNVTKQKQ